MQSQPSIELTWSEPPTQQRIVRSSPGRQVDPRLVKIAQQLRDNPGRPARIAVYDRRGSAHELVRRIRRGQNIWGPEGTFWAKSQSGEVWAWYLEQSAP